MPGIDLKRMWTGLRSELLAIWKFIDAFINDPVEIAQRGLVSSGILSPALTKGALGFVWATIVWIALLPLVMIASLAIFLLALPFSFAREGWRLFARPLTDHWADLRAPVARRITEISDTVRVFSQQTWRQRLLSVFKGIGLYLLSTVIGFFGLLLFISAIWIGIFLWWGGVLASSHLLGYGFFNGRDAASAGGKFTTVCNYRNLTQRDTISMTFDTSAARDAFSCPMFKRMGESKQ